MTLPPKLEKLVDNWVAKVIAFAAALFLYAYYQTSTLESRVLMVPLEIRGITAMQPVGQVDKYVRVTIRGDAAEINHLNREDFSAYVDLSHELRAGKVESRVFLDFSDRAAALDILSVEISPADVSVQLENLVAKYVPVQPVVIGSIPYGYEVVSVSCDPSEIRITGAEDLVSQVETVSTDGVFLDNHTESFAQSVAPYSVNHGISWDSADSVAVTVEIGPVNTEKEFSNVPLAILNVSSDFEYEIQTRRGSLVLSGAQLALDRYTVSPVGLFIDGSSIQETGEYRVPVVSGVSRDFSVTSFSPKEVVVVARAVEVIENSEESGEPLSEGTSDYQQGE